MKHIKDAKLAIERGDSVEALDILEGILAFSPKNAQALRLKAHIFDCQGRFEESLQILHQILKYSSSDDEEIIQDLEKRIEEDRESLVYTQISPEGRVYFPFSGGHLFLLSLGLLGCVVFLVTSPSYLGQPNGTLFVFLLFFLLVALPWISIAVMNSRGIKKILVGVNGISLFHGRRVSTCRWSEVGTVVVEYDENLKNDYLQMIILSKYSREQILTLDLSRGNSAIKARRHFLRLISTYADHVVYVPRGMASDHDMTRPPPHEEEKKKAS